MARRMKPTTGAELHDSQDLGASCCKGAQPDEVADAAHVLRAIAALPEAYRETLLRLVEGMSGQQIADLTGPTRLCAGEPASRHGQAARRWGWCRLPMRSRHMIDDDDPLWDGCASR